MLLKNTSPFINYLYHMSIHIIDKILYNMGCTGNTQPKNTFGELLKTKCVSLDKKTI